MSPSVPAMTTVRTAARLVATLAAAGLATTLLLAAPAEAADSLSGAITWTRTVTVNQTTPFSVTGTETTTGSLKVALAGVKASSKSGQGTDRNPKPC